MCATTGLLHVNGDKEGQGMRTVACRQQGGRSPSGWVGGGGGRYSCIAQQLLLCRQGLTVNASQTRPHHVEEECVMCTLHSSVQVSIRADDAWGLATQL